MVLLYGRFPVIECVVLGSIHVFFLAEGKVDTGCGPLSTRIQLLIVWLISIVALIRVAFQARFIEEDAPGGEISDLFGRGVVDVEVVGGLDVVGLVGHRGVG